MAPEFGDIKNLLQFGVFGLFGTFSLLLIGMVFVFIKSLLQNKNEAHATKILEKFTDGLLDIRSDTNWMREKINSQHTKLQDIRDFTKGSHSEMSMQTQSLVDVKTRSQKICSGVSTQNETLKALHKRLDVVFNKGL